MHNNFNPRAQNLNDEQIVLDESAAQRPSTPKKKSGWRVLIVGCLAFLVIWNGIVAIPVHNAMAGETNATTIVYRRWLVSPSQIVFDVRSVDSGIAMIDIDRRLLKAAEALQKSEFSKVVLAHRGEAKLTMDGPYFQEVGVTRQTQNPIYTLRTMQEHLSNLDGTPAFQTWTGGWLGVMGQQMDDHAEFHQRWWIRDEIK
jgi:hypothetical protein